MPAKLKMSYSECQLLARALNCCKPTLHFDAAQQAALPALGRKLAGYLAEPNYKANPKHPKKKTQHPKKLIGFAAVRLEDKDLLYLYASVNDSLRAAVAANPAPLE